MAAVKVSLHLVSQFIMEKVESIEVMIWGRSEFLGDLCLGLSELSNPLV